MYGDEPLSLKEKKMHKEIMRERMRGDDEPFDYAEHARSELRKSDEDKVIEARLDIIESRGSRRRRQRRGFTD